VKRYNPDTGRQVSVPADSWEADNWSSRKPSQAATKARKRVETQVARTAQRAVERGVGALAKPGTRAAVGAALLSATYLAVAGAVAYGATTAILKANAEGVTLPNLVAQARSMAAGAFQRKTGRYPTVAEYADLRKRIGNAILDAVAAQAGSIPAQWRSFVSLFKGE